MSNNLNGPRFDLPKKSSPERLNKIIEALNKGGAVSSIKYLKCIQDLYGPKKVHEVCLRYNLFIKKMPKSQIGFKDVRKLQQGLSDIRANDLDRFIKKLLSNEPLSVREEDVRNALEPAMVEQLKKHKDSSNLPSDLMNTLIERFKNPNKSYHQLNFTNPLTLGKISGIPRKSFQHGVLSHKNGRFLEDQERLKIYEEIQTLNHTEQSRYCELITKLLVKKHLYYEQEDKIKFGMLVPAPKGLNGENRWYKITELIDSGWGKFAYRLSPATDAYSDDMPELLLYRSSATLPAAMDCLSSYISDINVLPPGYLAKNRSKEQELRWLTMSKETSKASPRPLLITGHSLGASASQLALINLFESGRWVDRKISLELFDSPAISSSDAKKFASWYDKQEFTQPLTLNYYCSSGDIVPLVGSVISSSYLGSKITKPNVKAVVHKLELTKEGFKKQEIHGLNAHGRLFFRGKSGIEYRSIRVRIEEFDREKKYSRFVLNIIKMIGVILVWATIGMIGGLKRFFAGRRHHKPVIVKIFKKIFHKQTEKKIIKRQKKVSNLFENGIKDHEFRGEKRGNFG